MRTQLRNRLLGAGVLTALVVIFIPMIIEEKVEQASVPNVFPEMPNRQFNSPSVENNNGIFTPQIIPESTDARPVLDQNLVPTSPQNPSEKTNISQIASTSPKVKEKAKLQSKPESKKVIKSKTKGWVVQVGSFSNRNNAIKLVQTLKKKHFEAFLEKIKMNGRWLYRVRVGPEINKNTAKKIQAKISKAVNLKGSVVSYP